MKKFLLICLCVIVGAFSFAGCSGDSSKGNNPSDESGWTDFH